MTVTLMVNFYKTSTPEARAWSERSRGEYLGLAPSYQRGALAERNWTYTVDARRTTRVVSGSPATTGAPSSPGTGSGPSGAHGVLAATGPSASVLAAATATTAVGLALHRAHSPRG
jgi:hypothetical protein